MRKDIMVFVIFKMHLLYNKFLYWIIWVPYCWRQGNTAIAQGHRIPIPSWKWMASKVQWVLPSNNRKNTELINLWKKHQYKLKQIMKKNKIVNRQRPCALQVFTHSIYQILKKLIMISLYYDNSFQTSLLPKFFM